MIVAPTTRTKYSLRTSTVVRFSKNAHEASTLAIQTLNSLAWFEPRHTTAIKTTFSSYMTTRQIKPLFHWEGKGTDLLLCCTHDIFSDSILMRSRTDSTVHKTSELNQIWCQSDNFIKSATARALFPEVTTVFGRLPKSNSKLAFGSELLFITIRPFSTR